MRYRGSCAYYLLIAAHVARQYDDEDGVRLYDLLKAQPTGVRAGVHPAVGSSLLLQHHVLATMLPLDMSSRDYSPLKLARLVHRPFPRVSDEAFNLFHTTYEDQVLSNQSDERTRQADRSAGVIWVLHATGN